jgi:hypothetical protein
LVTLETPKSSKVDRKEENSAKSSPSTSGRQRQAIEASPAASASISPQVQQDAILLAIRGLFQKEFMPRIEGKLTKMQKTGPIGSGFVLGFSQEEGN